MSQNSFTNVCFIVDKYGHKIEVYKHNFYGNCVYKLWLDFDEEFHWNVSLSDDGEKMFNKMRNDFIKENSERILHPTLEDDF
jgi:hypothetical protein